MSLNPRTLRPSNTFTPKSISGLALWLDGSDASSLYTTDAGPVEAVSSPLDISGCVLWLDASDEATISDTAGAVDEWIDKSGNDNHAAASTTARPTTGSTSQNGLNTLSFNGVANKMALPSGAVLDLPATIFAVVKYPSSASATRYIIARQSSGANGGVLFRQNGTNVELSLLDAASPFPSLVTARGTGFDVLSVTATTSASALYKSGSQAASDATASGFANNSGYAAAIGGRPDANQDYWDSEIAEIIVYDTALTTSQRASVERYLAAKWGISGVHRSAAQEIAAVSDPTELAGCALWLDASDSDTVTTSSGRVTEILDKSGQGNDATEVSANGPTYQASAINGLPAMRFNGSSQFLAADGLAGLAGGQDSPLTVCMVISNPSVSLNGVALGWSDTSNNNPLLDLRTNATAWQLLKKDDAGASVTLTASPAITTSTPSVVSVSHAGAAASVFNNGGTVASGAQDVGTLTTTKFAIGCEYSAFSLGYTRFIAADIAEIIVYNRDLSSVDRARVEKYLQAKWQTPAVPNPTPPVGYWKDKSGNSRHATQATAASRPTVSATSLNNRAQLSLVSQHLIGPSSQWNGSVTAYWVGKTGQASSGAIVFSDGTVDQNNGFHFGWLNTQGVGAYGNGWNSGVSPRVESPSAWRSTNIVAGITMSSSEAVARVNGATVNTISGLTGALSQASPASFFVGRDYSNVWNNINGNIAEFLIYQPALSASQRAKVERYLAARWGITLAPQVANAEAQDWINRVYANGGTVSQSTANAVSTFCDAIEVASLRSRFARLNLFCGDSLNSALVPLFRNRQAHAGRNIITRNEEYQNTSYFVTSRYTLTSGSAAPTGAGSLKLTETADSGVHVWRTNYSVPITVGATYTWSVYVKDVTNGLVVLRDNASRVAVFDTATESVVAASSGVSAAISDEGSGWHRISMTFSAVSNPGEFSVSGAPDGWATAGMASYAGDITHSLTISSPQLELGSLSAYDPTPIGNATDTNNAFVGVGTDYSETGASGGLTGTSSKYLNTGLSPDAFGVATGHMSVWAKGSASAAAALAIGARTTGSTQRYEIATANRNSFLGDSVMDFYAASNWGGTASASYQQTGDSSRPAGLYLVSRTTSSRLDWYLNATSVANNTSTVTPGACANSIYVMARNLDGTASFTGAATCRGYSIGAAMSGSDVSALHAAWSAFNVAMERTP